MQEQFKQSLSRFTTGVCIITFDTDNGVDGVTISAFSSLSLSPLKILFCLGNQGRCHQAFNQVSQFAVSILSTEHKALAYQFAGNNRDNINTYIDRIHGVPVISGALSTLICNKGKQYCEGDHDIIIGEVVNIDNASDDIAPLLYFKSTIIEDHSI